MLSLTGIYSHLGLHEALEVVDKLKPVRTLFTGIDIMYFLFFLKLLYLWVVVRLLFVYVGMACVLGDHDKMNEKIHVTHPAVSLAYDGMLVDGFSY